VACIAILGRDIINHTEVIEFRGSTELE